MNFHVLFKSLQNHYLDKMESQLELQDFLEFDDLYKNLKENIFEKHVRGKPVYEDLVTSFQKLSNAIDTLLTRVGISKAPVT